MNSQGMAFKIPIYVYILGFELLPSIDAIAVPEMCHVFPEKNSCNSHWETEGTRK